MRVNIWTVGRAKGYFLTAAQGAGENKGGKDRRWDQNRELRALTGAERNKTGFGARFAAKQSVSDTKHP